MDTPFDLPLDRLATHALKWEKFRGRDVLPMWIADMDFRVAPAIESALVDFARRGDFGYCAAPPDLAPALAGYCRRMYDWPVDPAHIVWLPALVPAIQLAVRACCAPGQSALSFAPIYPPFLNAAALQDRRSVTLPLVERADGLGLDYVIDFDRLERTLAVEPGIRLLMLCHPHNPIGRPWQGAELERLAELCLRHDLRVLSDEVHADLPLDGRTRHTPFAALGPEIAGRTITINGPGKTYNTAGLGIAWAVIADPSLRSAFRKAMARLVPEPCTPAYAVLRAAIEACEPWRQGLLAYLATNRDRVCQTLAAVGLPHTRPSISYLAWFDARPLGIAPESLGAHFEQHGLGLSDGREFGLPGYLRLNFALPRRLLDDGLQRLQAAAGAGRGR